MSNPYQTSNSLNTLHPPTSSNFEALSSGANINSMQDGSEIMNAKYPEISENIDKQFAPDAEEDDVEENYNLPGIEEYFNSIKRQIAVNDEIEKKQRDAQCPPCR
jgi:hypothetical protein